MSTENNFFETEEGKDLANGVVNSFIKSVISYGVVDIEGLSDEEAREKIYDYLMDFISTEQEVNIVVDYKDSLLEEARRFVCDNKTNLALVTYATWWEHWINGVLESMLYRKEIIGKEFKSIITSLNNQAKTSWFLKLIELPPFEKDHLNVMNMLSEKRNGFIHYKYPIDTGESEDLDIFFKKVECSILYFVEYEHIYVFQSKSNLKI